MTVTHNFQSTALADNRVGDAGAEADTSSLSAEAGKRTRPCQFPAGGQQSHFTLFRKFPMLQMWLIPESQLIILVHGRACSTDTRRSWHHWQN